VNIHTPRNTRPADKPWQHHMNTLNSVRKGN